MGIRANNNIKLQRRGIGNKKLDVQKYRPSPWVEDAYDEHPWYDVQLTRDELLEAFAKLKKGRKAKNLLDAAGKFFASAGLRSHAYFGVAGNGSIWGMDLDAIVDNHHDMVSRAPNGEINITVPEDFRIELRYDRIVVKCWDPTSQKLINGKPVQAGAFQETYSVKFPQRYTKRDHWGQSEPLELDLEEEKINPYWEEWNSSDANVEALRSALDLLFTHYRINKAKKSSAPTK